MALKIDQLRSVMDLYPSTIWAKRAGVVLGVLLIERAPADAVNLLRAAQSDIPILDDYLRLWIGESLLALWLLIRGHRLTPDHTPFDTAPTTAVTA